MAKDIFVHMTVLVSPDGERDWRPIHLEDLPEWVLNTDVLARMASGEQCNNSAFGASWYRAVVSDQSMQPQLPKPSPIAQAVKSLGLLH